ncbi:hypothetical protein DID80_00215 [Candidatus Marinamargulisbacteria bacterium SCGC AAA071-K20]|nr:hypothetical protein DID80_00215 [Candidatus Marinamargulisbacteria bacterium SCGC AAA071-K20]
MKSRFLVIVFALSCQVIFAENSTKYNDALSLYYEHNPKKALETLNLIKAETKIEKSKKMIFRTVLLNIDGESNPNFKLDKELKKIDELYFVEFQNHFIQGDTIEGLKSLKKIKGRTGHQFLTKRSHLFLAKFYFQRGNFNKVKEHANRLVLQGGDSFLEIEGLKVLIELSIIERRSSEVMKLYGQLIQKFPQEDPHDQLWGRINIAFRKHLSIEDCFYDAKEHLVYLRSLFRQQYYKKVTNQASFMLKEYPKYHKINEVKFILAMTNYHQYRYEKSIPLFKEVIEKSNKRKTRDLSLLYLGLSLEKKQFYMEAEEVYIGLIKNRNRERNIVTRGYYLLAKLYYKKHLNKKYDEIKATFHTKYSSSRYYHQLNWEETQSKLLHYSKPEALESTLTNLINNPMTVRLIINQYKGMVSYYPKQDSEWADLLKTFVLSFNSVQHLNRYTLDPIPLRDEKSLFLKQVGLQDLVIQRLSYRINQEVPLDYKAWYEKIKLMYAQKQFYLVIDELTNLRSLAKQSRKEIPGYFVPYLYPIAHLEQIKKESQNFELDPYLLLAIIREESQFSANSKVDNKFGLFRLEPQSIKEYAFRLGHHWYGSSQLLEAEKNISYGIFYFSELYRLFDGNIYLSLMAFHKNASIARNYLIQNPLTTYEELLQIKDRESSEYIQRVLDSYVMYRVLYHGKI